MYPNNNAFGMPQQGQVTYNNGPPSSGSIGFETVGYPQQPPPPYTPYPTSPPYYPPTNSYPFPTDNYAPYGATAPYPQYGQPIGQAPYQGQPQQFGTTTQSNSCYCKKGKYEACRKMKYGVCQAKSKYNQSTSYTGYNQSPGYQGGYQGGATPVASGYAPVDNAYMDKKARKKKKMMKYAPVAAAAVGGVLIGKILF